MRQPVDVWVMRLVDALLGPREAAQGGPGVVRIARAAAVSPARLNMGAWFFGSQIAGSHYEFIRCLGDRERFCRRLAIVATFHAAVGGAEQRVVARLGPTREFA